MFANQAVRRSDRCNGRNKPNYVFESGAENEGDTDEEYVASVEEDEEDEEDEEGGDEVDKEDEEDEEGGDEEGGDEREEDEGEEEDEPHEDEPDEGDADEDEPEKEKDSTISTGATSTTARSSTRTAPAANTTSSTQFLRTFFCNICGEKFHQQEKFKQHKEQELAKLPASSEAVQPSIMPAPSRSQLPSTDFRSTTSSGQCNMASPQSHPVKTVSAFLVANCSDHAASSSPIVPPPCSTTMVPPKTTSRTSFALTFFCPDCGEVFHQLEYFKQHKEKELAKKNAVSAASAAATSASAAVKFAELASAAASAAKVALAKDFSAKASSLSLQPVPSDSNASSSASNTSSTVAPASSEYPAAASDPFDPTSTNTSEGSSTVSVSPASIASVASSTVVSAGISGCGLGLGGDEPDDSEEGSDDSEEAEVGVLGKLETSGVQCSCDGTKSGRVYKVKLLGEKKTQLMCKEKVVELGFYKKWLKSWVILRVLNQVSHKMAEKSDGRCLCEERRCNKLLVYEVQGWHKDKIECDWETKFHLKETGPGFDALARWEKEGKNVAKKIATLA